MPRGRARSTGGKAAAQKTQEATALASSVNESASPVIESAVDESLVEHEHELGFFAPATLDPEDAMQLDPVAAPEQEVSDDVKVVVQEPSAPAPASFNQRNKQQHPSVVAPSFSDLQSDPLSIKASQLWQSSNIKFDIKQVENIWKDDLVASDFSIRTLTLLEYSQYLELASYLWPHFNPSNASPLMVLSIVCLVNEKMRQRISGTWDTLTQDADRFHLLFEQVSSLLLSPDSAILTLQTRRFLVMFMIHCYSSLENSVIRSLVFKYVGISTWYHLTSDKVREDKIISSRVLVKAWASQEKKYKKAGKSLFLDSLILDKETKKQLEFQRSFIYHLVIRFLQVLESIPAQGPVPPYAIPYCERMVEFFLDIETQLPTRRYINTLFKDVLLMAFCKSSGLYKRGLTSKQGTCENEQESGILFCHLVDRLDFYAHFEMDELTGQALTLDQVSQRYYHHIQTLQKVAFSEFQPDLRELALVNAGKIDQPDLFQSYFTNVSDQVLIDFCKAIGMQTSSLTAQDKENSRVLSRDFLMVALTERYCKKPSQMDLLNSMPLYPDENLLFDETTLPDSQSFTNSHCLSIPKLNLQFLTAHDHLLRNFQLFRLESAHDIRQDVEDVVKRYSPEYNLDKDTTSIKGWARMAHQLVDFQIVEVGPSKMGDAAPSFVKADIAFDLSSYSDSIRKEWDSLRPRDVLFLLSIRMTEKSATATDFKTAFGVQFVRGCEIIGLIDEEGNPIEEFNHEGAAKAYILNQENKFRATQGDELRQSAETRMVIKEPGPMRKYRVLLDTNQYHADLKYNQANKMDIYQSGNQVFQLVMRRKPQENNFKAVLETIRDLIRMSEVVIPPWLHDIFLGYGDPSSAHYKNMSAEHVVRTIDFRDTFLDWQHLVESFPDKTLVPINGHSDDKNPLCPPFILTFPKSMFTALENSPEKEETLSRGVKRKLGETASLEASDSILVQSYKAPYMGPYPEVIPKQNSVRFTPAQVESILSGTSAGLTLVVGPPGTGKTDVAVQIIANLYHNHPEQHTLLITHSNQALNQLFEKITRLDIDPRHLLRLGHGEEDLDVQGQGSWGKYGRVNLFLETRLKLLSQVDRLAKSLNMMGAHGSTCETAGYFFHHHVQTEWGHFERFIKDHQDQQVALTAKLVQEHFPFTAFFADAPEPVFPAEVSAEEALERARGCFRYLVKIFEELQELRAFELLRSNYDRSNYLLMKEAKIIALTCTHAALKRKDLVRLGFKYDNVIVEEAAQILEVESFIPLLLQTPDVVDGVPESRLKRVVMIGDHHQLPPVVKNTAFQRYGNMEQSLFTRFVKLGVPVIQLDKQGRSRSSLADLFRWNYKNLGDLPSVLPLSLPANDSLETNPFGTCNPGLVFDYQVVNVPDFHGQGESEPVPYFIQNLGEAEYVVAMFMYMRLIGYPADKISILTTYNGQRELIQDVLNQRCSWNPLFGQPRHVSTVDKYQGQQNDYILLSLVRTKSVGHLRDVRRLIVALSRARLGLYVFCRTRIFQNCVELRPAFECLLRDRPDDALWLQQEEKYEPGFTRKQVENGVEKTPKKKKGRSNSKPDPPIQEPLDLAQRPNVLGIRGVEPMGQYVYDMLQEHIARLKKEKQESV